MSVVIYPYMSVIIYPYMSVVIYNPTHAELASSDIHENIRFFCIFHIYVFILSFVKI